MIFPIILSKYLASSEERHSLGKPDMASDSPQQHQPDSNQTDEVDGNNEQEDEFDDSLLNTTMDTNLSNTLNRNRQAAGGGVGEPERPRRCRVSPKYLLNKALRCRNNKYWLVQNKYAETISNLDYILLSAAFGEEFRYWLMVSFSFFSFLYFPMKILL